jgi:hypothetical protein
MKLEAQGRKHSLSHYALIALVLLSGCAFQTKTAENIDRPENGWKRIQNYAFSFSIPSTLKKTDARGIDSFVEEYTSDEIEISFDYGLYSNNFFDWPPETKFEKVKVDGRPAKIGTKKNQLGKRFAYSTQVYIKMGDGALSMFASCKSEKEVALARRIFETILFK